MSTAITVCIPSVRIPEHIWIAKTMLSTYLGLEIVIEQHELPTIVISQTGSPCTIELPSILLTTHPTQWELSTAVPTRVPHWIDQTCIPWSLPEPDVKIPVLYASAEAEIVELTENHISLPWDLFGSSFFMLSRLEEILLKDEDIHGRFPASATLAVRAGFERTPVVNVWGEILWKALVTLWPGLKRQERQYELFVSHDVDWPLASQNIGLAKLIRASAGDIFVRKSVTTGVKRLVSNVLPGALGTRINPANTFDFIMRTSEQHGIASAFYFIPENTAGLIDGTYDLDMPFVRDLLSEISTRGHEIGIHPGYETWRSPERLRSGFQELLRVTHELGINQECWGGRQHFLRWSAQETWRHWAAAGLNYDSTVGYAETVGFRTGACFDYPVFDILARQELNLTERPLVVMEGAIFAATTTINMMLDDQEGLDVLAGLHRSVRAYNGGFSLLWHNSSLVTKQQQQLYTQTLQILT